MTSVKLYDSTLREGTQSEDVAFSVAAEVRIAHRLDEVGVHYIEGGWPASNPRDFRFFRQMRAETLRQATLVARLEPRSAKGAGRALAHKRLPQPPAELDLHLPVPQAPGEYVLVVELQGLKGKIYGEARTEVPLHKLPPAKDEWYVGENNVLYHNGQAFLPFGWFSMPEKAFLQEQAEIPSTADHLPKQF